MSSSSWVLRRELHEGFSPTDVYNLYPTLITARINHGGVFTPFPGRRYINGKTDLVDLINTDHLSVRLFDKIMIALGYEMRDIVQYHFLIPSSDLDTGLRDLMTDLDIANLLNYAPSNKLIDVFIEHGKTNNAENLDLNQSSDHFHFNFDPFIELDSGLPEVGQRVDLNQRVDSNNVLDLNQGLGVNNVVDVNQGLGVNNVNDMGVDMNQGDGNHGQYMWDKDPLNQGSGNHGELERHDSNDHDSFDGFEADIEDYVDTSGEWLGVNCGEDSDTLNVQGDIDPFEVDNFDSVDEDEEGSYCHQNRHRATKGHGVDFYLGQAFGNKDTVRNLIKQHSIETKRDIVVVKNDRSRIRAVCRGTLPQLKDEGESNGPGKGRKSRWKKPNGPTCPWVLYLSTCKREETWRVKTYFSTHKCFQTREVGMATATFLSKHIIQQLKVDPNMPLKAIQCHLSEKFEILVSPSKAMRVKQIATKTIWGDYELQYDQLRDYLGEVQRCNPETTIKLEVETEPNLESDTRQFKRVYICLGALKRGFKAGKRDLLGLDGTFMKGPFPGQVLTAVGIDPNHGIYPVAYAVVESESTLSWSWFLECLGDDLDLQSNSKFTFISDRQKV
ncbi:hypothetical protein L6452_42271 [Arctium lappa]|uniref:Uncharacterized protein n=1 Tax=Arctium lappa TaxID=4217 RepID=A0ACB8XIC9_ARCLA|nr:hypothetical protein L6452_42271 [Arctium lappa]